MTILRRLLIFISILSFKPVNSQCSATAFWATSDCFGTCNGTASVNATGLSPFTYGWSNGQTTQTATGLCESMCYTVTIVDANGCSSSSVACLPNRNQVVITIVTPPSCPTCCDGVLSSSITPSFACSPYITFWDGNTNSSNTLNNVCPGIHTRCIWDACGCQVCDSIFVSFTTSTEIPEDKSSFNILPNPNNGIFQFIMTDLIIENEELEVYNYLGEMIYKTQITQQQTEINFSDKPKGLYFLKIESENKFFTRKIVID